MIGATVCSHITLINVMHIIKSALNLIQIMGPILAMVALYINFTKATVNPVESDNYKVKKNIFNSLMATVILFFLPALVNLIFFVLSNSGIAPAMDVASCWNESESLYQSTKANNSSSKYDESKFKPGNPTASNIVVSSKAIKKIKKKSKSNKKSKKTTRNGKKHKLSNYKIRYLAAICMREQGNVEAGMRGEANLIANRYELFGKKYSDVYDYVKNSGWFGRRSVTPTNNKKAINIVKSVIVNGNRDIPLYIDQHGCWFCNKRNYCRNGNQGDICSITGGHSKSYITNRKHYKQDKTKINSVYGGQYIFYYFPASNSDPFGYTKQSYKKVKAMND